MKASMAIARSKTGRLLLRFARFESSVFESSSCAAQGREYLSMHSIVYEAFERTHFSCSAFSCQILYPQAGGLLSKPRQPSVYQGDMTPLHVLNSGGLFVHLLLHRCPQKCWHIH